MAFQKDIHTGKRRDIHGVRDGDRRVIRIGLHVIILEGAVDDIHQISAVGNLRPRPVMPPWRIVHHRAAPDAFRPHRAHREARIMPTDPAVLRIRADAIAAALFLARIVRENKGCQRILLLPEHQVEVGGPFLLSRHQLCLHLIGIRRIIYAELILEPIHVHQLARLSMDAREERLLGDPLISRGDRLSEFPFNEPDVDHAVLYLLRRQHGLRRHDMLLLIQRIQAGHHVRQLLHGGRPCAFEMDGLPDLLCGKKFRRRHTDLLHFKDQPALFGLRLRRMHGIQRAVAALLVIRRHLLVRLAHARRLIRHLLHRRIRRIELRQCRRSAHAA